MKKKRNKTVNTLLIVSQNTNVEMSLFEADGRGEEGGLTGGGEEGVRGAGERAGDDEPI